MYISKGYIRTVAKLLAVKGLMDFSHNRTQERLDKLSEGDREATRDIENELSPIRDYLKEYTHKMVKNFSQSHFKALKSYGNRLDRILNDRLGYMGAGLNIVKIINHKRNIKGYDLDIIALYLLERIAPNDFKYSSEKILQIARYINGKYDIDNSAKIKDRIAHIGKVNSLIVFFD